MEADKEKISELYKKMNDGIPFTLEDHFQWYLKRRNIDERIFSIKIYELHEKERFIKHYKDYKERYFYYLKKFENIDVTEQIYLRNYATDQLNKDLNNQKHGFFKEILKDLIDEISGSKNIISNSLKWQGTQTEIVELIKALIENGSIKGKQKDIIKSFELFFEIETSFDSTLKNLRGRNSDNTTKFLNELVNSFNQYDLAQIEKNKNNKVKNTHL